MWIKEFVDGTRIVEDRKRGITWKKTPLVGIVRIYMQHEDSISPSLTGMEEYWHSRGAVLNPETEEIILITERIQGRLGESWLTITWDGKTYIHSVENKAYGKPIE